MVAVFSWVSLRQVLSIGSDFHRNLAISSFTDHLTRAIVFWKFSGACRIVACVPNEQQYAGRLLLTKKGHPHPAVYLIKTEI